MRWPGVSPRVRLRQVATLEPPANHDCLGSVSIGPAGQAVALWTDPAGLDALSFGEPQAVERAGPLAGPAASVTVTVDAPARVRSVEIAGVRGMRPVAQPLPGERVLLVGCAADWRPEGPDENATVYGSDGRPRLSACVGDAVGQVRATLDGSVWVGYADMGIFGPWGDGAGVPEPIGAPGLVRFTPDLTVAWEYPGGVSPNETSGSPGPIDDCEAISLGADGHTVWMYYYASFPVVRIAGGQEVRAWSPRAREGAVPVNVQALACHDRHVALAGAHGRNYAGDRVMVARLEDGWTPVGRPRLVLPDGSRLPAAVTMAGFGDTLHVFVGRDWYQVAVADLL